jgi:inhibitor of cysteine peptidase
MEYFKVAIFIVTLFFLTCDANAELPKANTASKTAPKTLTMEDNGKNIDLGIGETIKVELKDIGTTGYAWYTDGLYEPYLKLISEEVKDISPENREKGPVLGAPTMKIWTFKAIAPGDMSLRLLQYRAWEGKEKAINKFEVKLHITDKK